MNDKGVIKNHTLLVFLVICYVGCTPPQSFPKNSNREKSEWECIVWVSSNDMITMMHVHGLLSSYGIENQNIGGSRLYGIIIPKKDINNAKKILIEDARKRKYGIIIDDYENTCEKSTDWGKETINNFYTKVLEDAKYSPLTIWGKVIREEEIREAAKKFPYLSFLKYRKREYLNREGETKIGYEIEIHLTLTDKKGKNVLYFQAWDDGNGIKFTGGNSWKEK